MFTDEESLKSHVDVDHGVEEAVTKQSSLHRQHIPRGKLIFPTDTEPEDEDQGVPTTGSQGYNPNPNAGLYDNKLFRTGSSTERTSQLGEAFDSPIGITKEQTIIDWKNFKNQVKQGNREPYLQRLMQQGGDSAYFRDASDEEILQAIDQYLRDEVYGAESKAGENWNNEDIEKLLKDHGYHEHDYDIEGNCKVCGWSMDQIQSGDDRYWREHPDELRKKLTEAKASEDAVNYNKADDQSIGFIEQQHTEPKEDKNKELDYVNITEESIDYVYKTKSSEAKEKAYTTEAKMIEGLEEEYKDFEDSDESVIEETITVRKLGGYSEESIARELHITYGVSHEEALEKVYSVEVSTNDKVAQTFFGKMYKECTESEKDELRMYSGSD
jgi:hypothetical protein